MNVGGPPPGSRPTTASQAAAQPAAGAAGAAGGAASAARPSAAMAQQKLQPGSLQMKTPEGFRPPGGSTLHAQVAGKDGQGYLLRMGQHLVRAQSGTPLQVGQSVQMQVQSETGGQMRLQMLPGGAQSKHNIGDLTQTLASLKMPATEANLETAKALVENKLPLTKENMETMSKLTQAPEGARNPAPLASRVTAAVLLQQNNLPVSPQNVGSIANFLAQNPQLGQQMIAMNDELRRMASKGLDSKEFEGVREMMISVLDGESGGAITKTKDKKVPPKKFFNAAKQAGIEFGPGPFPGAGEDEWEILAAYRELRRKAAETLGEEEASTLGQLLEQAEENVTAQRLLNKCVVGELGCLYFQVPLRLELREDAEVWLYYRRKGNGDDDLGDEFRAEFLVNTEHLGSLFFVVEVGGIDVAVTIEVEEARVLSFVERFTPVLAERIGAAGWRCQGVQVSARKTVPGNPWLQQQESIAEMISYDVQA
jgi:hypothetical protein